MKLISIGTFAREVGLTSTTLRRMHKTGELVPTYVSKGGTRYYSAEQLKKFSHQESQSNLVIGYCRVSTPAQKDDLEKQVENVKAYMYAKGYEFEIIRDIGSGINYKKKGLRALIEKINNQEVSKVVILYKDRLVRTKQRASEGERLDSNHYCFCQQALQPTVKKDEETD